MAEPDYDSPAAHTAEIGGSGGITNARGLACLYAPAMALAVAPARW